MYIIYLFISHHCLCGRLATFLADPGWCVHAFTVISRGHQRMHPKTGARHLMDLRFRRSIPSSKAPQCCSRVFLGCINYPLNQYMIFHFFKFLLQSRSSLVSQTWDPHGFCRHVTGIQLIQWINIRDTNSGALRKIPSFPLPFCAGRHGSMPLETTPFFDTPSA